MASLFGAMIEVGGWEKEKETEGERFFSLYTYKACITTIAFMPRRREINREAKPCELKAYDYYSVYLHVISPPP